CTASKLAYDHDQVARRCTRCSFLGLSCSFNLQGVSIDRTRFANKRRGNNGGDCREKRRPGDACSDTAIVAANIVADSWALLSLGLTLKGRRPDAGCPAERAGAGTERLPRAPSPRSPEQRGAWRQPRNLAS